MNLEISLKSFAEPLMKEHDYNIQSYQELRKRILYLMIHC